MSGTLISSTIFDFPKKQHSFLAINLDLTIIYGKLVREEYWIPGVACHLSDCNHLLGPHDSGYATGKEHMERGGK